MEFVDDVENKYTKVVCKNVYQIKDDLKAMGGRFNFEEKFWYIPIEKKLEAEGYYQTYLEYEERKAKDMWKRACSLNNVKFAKKGTPEYNKVRDTFINLMKNN